MSGAMATFFTIIGIIAVVVVALLVWAFRSGDIERAKMIERKKAALFAVDNFVPELLHEGSLKGHGVAIDPAARLIAFASLDHPTRVYRFDQIIAVEAVRDGEAVTATKGKVSMKGVAVGTALFGPIGLLAGASTSSSSQTTNMVSSLNLKVIVNDLHNPSYEVSFFNFGLPLAADHAFVKESANDLDQWYGRFRAIMAMDRDAA